MENNELMNTQTAAPAAELLETVLVDGDLSKLTAQQRLDYYGQVCKSLGLNPLTRPFDYINLGGRLTLYARKDATDQLRSLRGVCIDDVSISIEGDIVIATAKGTDYRGRKDVEIGAVNKRDLSGKYENVIMKAVTKAKRRLTLSLCGLGMLDETEVETIPESIPVIVSETGEIVQDLPKPAKPAEQKKREWNEDEFLAQFTKPANVPDMETKAAETYTDSNDKPYKDLTTRELYGHWCGLAKAMKSQNAAEQELTSLKIGAICRILQNRKIQSQIKDPNGGRKDPFVGQKE